jgi:hypothetical protein
MGNEQFRKLHWTSPTGSPTSAMCPPQIAAQRAALLFGCYRRGDANDPETYSAAEVKQACIKRQAYLDRLAEFDSRFANRRPAAALPKFDKTRPGRRANVFVQADDRNIRACLR